MQKDFSDIFDPVTPEEETARLAARKAELGVRKDAQWFPGKSRTVSLEYAGDVRSQTRNGHVVETILARNEQGPVTVLLDEDRAQGADKGVSYRTMLFAVSRLDTHGGKVAMEATGQYKRRDFQDAAGVDRHVWEFRAEKLSMTGLNAQDERETYTVGFDKREAAPRAHTPPVQRREANER